jgi:hypothetical protein
LFQQTDGATFVRFEWDPGAKLAMSALIPAPHIHVPLPVLFDSRVEMGSKMVLFAVAARGWVAELLDLKYADIAQELGLLEKEVRAHLDSLCGVGWLKVTKKTDSSFCVTFSSPGPSHNEVLSRCAEYFLRPVRTEDELRMLRSEIPLTDAVAEAAEKWFDSFLGEE